MSNYKEKFLDIFAGILAGTAVFTVFGAFLLMFVLFMIRGIGFIFDARDFADQIVEAIFRLLWLPAGIIGIVGTLAYTLSTIGFIQWTGSWFDEKLEPLWKWVEKQISKIYNDRK